MKHLTKLSSGLIITTLLLFCVSLMLSIFTLARCSKNEKLLLEKNKVLQELKKTESTLKEDEAMLHNLKKAYASLPHPSPSDFLPPDLKQLKFEAREIKRTALPDEWTLLDIELTIDDFDLANLVDAMKHLQKFYPALSIKEISILSSSQKPGFARLSLLLNLLEPAKR
jgi:hypothetical protein